MLRGHRVVLRVVLRALGRWLLAIAGLACGYSGDRFRPRADDRGADRRLSASRGWCCSTTRSSCSAIRYVLTSESLGLRQWGVLDLEIRKYRRDIHQPALANLAVGSSQVGAIFYQWDSPPPDAVGVYSLAGMKSLDFVLNEDAIAAMHPARMILYLSAFDMTGSPELFSLPLAPPQWRTIWPVYARLRAAGLTSGHRAEFSGISGQPVPAGVPVLVCVSRVDSAVVRRRAEAGAGARRAGAGILELFRRAMARVQLRVLRGFPGVLPGTGSRCSCPRARSIPKR